MLKRVVDIVVGTLLAVAVTPLVVVLALVVALMFRTNPFFVQQRVGLGGRPFRIVKLRTMPPQTRAYADKYELEQLELPWFAATLRALKVDELPQLWLVPLGRMSLVGPRPEMAFLHDRLTPASARARTSVRPGCTGLWQISLDAGGLIHEHPEYDVAYVMRRSFRLDAWIIWHTLRMMLGRPAQITLDQIPTWAATHVGEGAEPSRA